MFMYFLAYIAPINTFEMVFDIKNVGAPLSERSDEKCGQLVFFWGICKQYRVC